MLVYLKLFFLFFLVCPVGFYGVACNNKCGNCRDVSQCHHITGACVSGCDAGYKGDLCKTREYKCNQGLLSLCICSNPTQHDYTHVS